MRSLSKSKIISYRQCAKRLWLEVHKPELKADSAATQKSYAIGNEVGNKARVIYDPNNTGTLIDPFKDGFKNAFEKTSFLLKQGKPIFEATITADGALALADVMMPAGNGEWKMVEVKSSTRVKDYQRDDVSVQTYIAKAADISLSSVALACVDSSWIYPGNNDYSGLLKETDLTDEALARENEVKAWVTGAKKVVLEKEAPSIEVGSQCNKPFLCGFFSFCTQGKSITATYPVSWLPRVQSKSLKRFIKDNQVVDMAEIPNEILNPLQMRVKDATLSGIPYFDSEGAKKDLSGLKLPGYFLDFETIQFAVPIWKGTRPYQQIPFQFSLHKMNSADDIAHYEFLDISGNDPSEAFARQLVEQCGNAGPVYVYNASFERSRMKELAKRFPAYSEQLIAINARVVGSATNRSEKILPPHSAR